MLKNSFVYLIGQGISSVISFILLPIYTHLLTPNEFGIASLFITTIFLGITFFSFGLNTGYMIKYFKVDNTEKKKLFSIVAVLFLLVLPIIIMSSPFTPVFKNVFGFNFNLFHLFVLGLSIFAGLYYQFFVALLKVQQKAVVFVFFNIGYALLLGCFNLLLIIVFRQKYLSFLYSMFLVNVIFALVGVVYYRDFFIKLKIQKEGTSARELLRISWPIIPSQISSSVLSSADRYVLNALVGPNPVGLYSVGSRFFSFIESFLLYPFFNSYNPVAYELFVKDREAFKELQKKYLIYFSSIMALFFLFTSIFFEDFFKLVFDERYWPAYSTIGLLALAQFFQGLSFLFNAVQTMFEKLYYSMYLIMSAALLNIILNFILIPKFSFLGSALATMISYCFICIGSYVINQKIFRIAYACNKVITMGIVVVLILILQHAVDFGQLWFRLSCKFVYAILGLVYLLTFNSSLRKSLLKQLSILNNKH